MIKNFAIIIAAILIVGISVAQNCSCNKIYETDLRSLTIKPDSFQIKKDWLSSVVLNRTQLLDSITDYANYRLAASYSMLNNLDSACLYLNQFLDMSIDDRCILVDERFNNLRNDYHFWSAITKRIEQHYLVCLDSCVNKEYALKLFYLGVKDQKYRKYYPTLRQSFDGIEWAKNDLQNDSAFSCLVKKYGFPSLSKVGKLASTAGFLIIQHGKTKYKHYRMLVKAYKKGDFEAALYAKTLDRWRTDHHRKQLYGTSWYRSHKTTPIYGDKWVLEPVKDFKNLNKRRLSMGLCTIEEELTKNPNQVIPNEYYQK